MTTHSFATRYWAALVDGPPRPLNPPVDQGFHRRWLAALAGPAIRVPSAHPGVATALLRGGRPPAARIVVLVDERAGPAVLARGHEAATAVAATEPAARSSIAVAAFGPAGERPAVDLVSPEQGVRDALLRTRDFRTRTGHVDVARAVLAALPADDGRPRVVYLLTTGTPGRGARTVFDRLAAEGVRVVPIGVPPDLAALPGVAAEAVGRVRCGVPVRRPATPRRELVVAVPDGARVATIAVDVHDPRATAVFLDPTGAEHHPPPGTGRVAVLRRDDPEPGDWRVRLSTPTGLAWWSHVG
ncbi:hypothetical protein [Saccharothrix obliqua]|uniref:hypothetical protein n=1 Tax=Saccharothrix obliqua TaxID=2861747 RepID=UPI001C5DE88F|nr:hypothetical protein [Saccharothrix obliqua]MBW4721911.1 hypothetical protein [Saccharothrix obliqua]